MTMRPEVRYLGDRRLRQWCWLSNAKVMSTQGCNPEPHVFLEGISACGFVPLRMIEIGSWFDNRKLRLS